MSTIYVLLGASGSGKSTLGDYLKEELGVKELISHTDREMREGEEHGNPYYFVNKSDFNKHNFVERVEYAGNRYGLTNLEVKNKLENNDKMFVIMEKHGIEQLKNYFPDVEIEIIYIYATIEECINRMSGRKPKKIIQRIKNSAKDKEINNHDIADYIIRNKDLDKAKKQIKCIFS